MSAVETLEGELLELVRKSEDGAWGVARLGTADGGEALVVGPLAHVAPGQHLRLEGAWTRHARFGRQFRARGVLVDDPRTTEALKRYLASEGVPGLGPKLAARVVERFGLDTLRVLDEAPERLMEVSGVGARRVERVREHWERERAGRALAVMLRAHGLGAAVARRVQERYGEDAAQVVTSDPYRLASEIPGVAFRTADAIARSLGIEPGDARRARAALVWLMAQAEAEGHCFLPRDELVSRARALDLDPERVEAVLEEEGARRLALEPAATPGLGRVYRRDVQAREARVARRVAARCLDRRPDEVLALAAERRAGLSLDEAQRRAVASALAHGLTVITGGPGTGKTTIVRVLMEAVQLKGETWALAAPTGRAARRLSESCGAEGQTLHRLLEVAMPAMTFQRNAANPLAVQGLLVDEASMIDLALMDALLDALPEGARLVLVGDADQLPSVGAGQVLRDLIDCGEVPVVSLSRVYRQAEGSGIVRNAHRILRGELPVSGQDDPEGARDFFLLPRREPEELVAALVKVVTERLPELGFEPRVDLQVLTPMRRGPLGTRALNEVLQAALNPEGKALKRGGRELREGDRVMQLVNDYEHEVFNGDVGRVVAVSGGAIEVDFDGRRVALVGEQLDAVDLAYATSIHKSQGSEYPAVLVVLHGSHFVMLRRNLIYTAVTRARRFCCVLGPRSALARAVTQAGGGERWTGLASRLRREMGY